ncbi:MAG: DUF1570 domain-containing protein [Planctomycetaceae bacterium]
MLAIVALLVGLLTTPIAWAAKSSRTERALANLQTLHHDAHQLFADDLERIAQTCEANGLRAIAPRIRQIAEPVDPDVLRFEPLPRQVQPTIPVDPDGGFSWQAELRTHRKAYAAELDKFATQAAKAGLPSSAYQLIREVAFHDPDHPRARRLLGFVRHKEEWVSPFEASKLKKNEVWTDQWGWLPGAHVARYQNGERLNGSRWVPAALDAQLRQDFSKGWEIRTEHYLLKTNLSLEEGVALASSLEEFQRFFEQTFAGFFNDSKRIQLLFDSPAAAARSVAKPFQIHFFRSKAEYVARLRGKYGEVIKITNGLYDTDDMTVYSFHNPQAPAEPTLYHEATHQLLAANLRPSPVIAKEENFWLIEGIACYIESFRVKDGEVSLGDPRCERFIAARYRKIVDRYYLPLAEFTAMGKDAFQAHPQIENNYSQASGLAHFFMHYEGGRYRDDLIEHIRQLYQQAETGRRPDSLEKLTGVDFADLDQQYGEYVRRVSMSLEEDFVKRP